MHILVFAGTQDGNQIASMMSERQIEVDVCVATEYGEECLLEDCKLTNCIANLEQDSERTPYIHCHTGRLTTEQMENLMKEHVYEAVIDATHPFATQVSDSIRQACQHAELEYIRFSRDCEIDDIIFSQQDKQGYGSMENPQQNSTVTFVEDVMEASQKLASFTNQRILFTTGSKDVKQLTSNIVDKKDIFVRVLPAIESLQLCEEAQIPKKQIIAMQGPFSTDMNLALIKELQIDVLVTKESGATGGYPEKIQAAMKAGIKVLVIRNPEKKKSYNWQTLCVRLETITGMHFSFNKISELNQNEALKEISDKEDHAKENHIKEDHNKGEHKKEAKVLSIIGIGPGSDDLLTTEAKDALQNADLIFGAESILSHVAKYSPRKVPIYQREKILAFLEENNSYNNSVLVCSGDVGFYSGAAAFHDFVDNCSDFVNRVEKQEASKSETGNQSDSGSFQIKVCLLPGISSMQYFCAKIGMSWQDVAITSIHGRQANVIGKVRTNQKIFVLVSGREDVLTIAGKLMQYHMEHCKMTVGYQLSTEDEQMIQISLSSFIDKKEEDIAAEGNSYNEIWNNQKPEDRDISKEKRKYAIDHFMNMLPEKDGLYVLLIQNEKASESIVTPGIPDEAFIRGKVPMTKEEVREVSIAKLHLQKNSILYDIGAGTGSISIEAARLHDSIKVVAVEKNPEAVELLQQNKEKFAVDNLEIIEGTAPEIFEEMNETFLQTKKDSTSAGVVPTHAFIGGSSGNLSTIIHQLLEMNPQIRIVINTVTLETLSEVTQILKTIPHEEEDVIQLSVTKTRQAGAYHLMQAANPVMIISFTGNGL